MSGRIVQAAPPEPDAAGMDSARRRLDGLAALAFGSLTHADAAGPDAPRRERPELDLDDPAQRRFGDYELLECIGEGGMGVVYRARHLPLDRIVAIKLLAAGPWATPDFIARFELEARNAARMQHPHIVTVFEVGSLEGLHFFSMRLVDGESLAAMLKRDGPLAPRRAATLLRTLAQAVGHAHSLGVLHLDLKPANVFIDRDGTPLVGDFGLARRIDEAHAVGASMAGTPAYMAPEQAAAEDTDPSTATDVWGLGAILYSALTGMPPFPGQHPAAILEAAREGRVPAPRGIDARIPRDLDAIALRCLRRDPSARYPSAAALADDLERFLDGRPVLARPLSGLARSVRWARREPRLAAALLAVTLSLVGGLAATTTQWYRAEANARTAAANAATSNRQLWDARGAAALAATETRNDWDAAPLLLANVAEMERQGDLTRAAGMRRTLGIVRNTNAALIDAVPVQARAVAVAMDGEGKRIAVSGEETGIRVFDAATGNEIMRTAAREFDLSARLHFADAGRTLVASIQELSAHSPRPAGGRSRRLDVGGGKWLEPPPAFANLKAASYSGDGRYAVLTAEDGRAQAWATTPWRPLGPLAALPYRDADEARIVAPGGRFFALAGPGGAVTLVDGRSMQATRVALDGFGDVAAWTLSADARWLAAGDFSGRVAVVDTATHAVRFAEPRAGRPARWLAFSADGHWLALAAQAGGVYLWSWPDGRLLVPPFGGSSPPHDRPLAEFVALDRERGRVLVADDTANTSIWQVTPESPEGDVGEAQRISAAVDPRASWGVQAVAWAPDAGIVASVADRRLRVERLRAPELLPGRGAPLAPGRLHFDGRHVVAVAGARVTRVDARTGRPSGATLELDRSPGFAELTADGRTLVVIAGRRLQAFDADTGAPRFAPVELGGTPTEADLAPDGTRIAIGWLANDKGAARATSEMVVLHELSRGARLAGPVALPGPTNETLAFSPDGARLLAWNPRELSLRDGRTLAPIQGPLAAFEPRGHDPDSHRGFVGSAAFTAAGDVVAIYTKNDGSNWVHELRRYPRAGSALAMPMPAASPILRALPVPRSDEVIITSDVGPFTRLISPDGRSRELPDPGDAAISIVAAVSPDGRWLARARRDGVALFDLHTRSRITTLHVPLPRPDEVRQLAFSPDGKRLLARSVRSRSIVWNLAPDERPVAAIARELALRDLPAVDGTPPGAAGGTDPDARERGWLRAGDPGAPPPMDAGKPAREAAAIPPRERGVAAALLDLTAHYSFGLGASAAAPPAPGDPGWLTPGVQRFQGVDYDVRGGIRLGRGQPARIDLRDARGGRHFAALDVLLLPPEPMRSAAMARLTLHYADGSIAVSRLALDAGALAYWRTPGRESTVRFAAFGFDARTYAGSNDGTRSHALALHLVQPQPERPVIAMTFEPDPDDRGASAVILAVTLSGTP